MTVCATNDFPECTWNAWLWFTAPFILLFLGTFGNILNVIILVRPRMRKYSTTIYLICLAFADTSVLWTAIPPEMLKRGFLTDVYTHSNVLCKMIKWVNHASAGFSAWLLVLLTAERMLLTKSPVFARSKMTRKSSVIAAMCVLIISVGLSSHYLFGVEVRTFQVQNGNISSSTPLCTFASTSFEDFYTEIWPLMVLIVINLFPTILILIGNGVIVATLILQRRKLIKVNPLEDEQKLTKYKKVKSSSKMIFLICGFFIFTTFPYTSFSVLKWKIEPADAKAEARLLLIDTCLHLLVDCNFTFNFLLYFVSGSLFKEELKLLLTKLYSKIRNKTESTTAVRNTNTTSV